MLWLYLLGVVTFLTIVLRRVLRRQRPLSEALYTTTVAVDHVHSGVAFVEGQGKIASLNQSLAESLGANPVRLAGGDWYNLFPETERETVRQAYALMLIRGIATLETVLRRADGSFAPAHVRLVAAHDGRMRALGHHCLIHDLSQVRLLEDRIQELENDRAAGAVS